MYKKDKSLVLKGSTSALANNLSVLVNLEKSTINYAVVHKSAVNVVSMSMDGSTVNHRQVACKEPSATSASMILQARLVAMEGRTILVFASQKGIQMYEADGSIMLYWYALGDLVANDADACFGRGICGVQSDTICIGTHSGEIHVFHIPAKGTNITMSETLKGHRRAICDLESADQRMVSSDDSGTVILWKQVGESFQQVLSVPGSGAPCTSVALWNDAILAGFATGHLRIFSSSSGNLSAEATAHTRCITAVNVSKSGQVISVAEDSWVRIWKIKSGSMPSIEHVWSEAVTDVQLQGGKFIDASAKAFVLTGYDSNSLHFYSTV